MSEYDDICNNVAASIGSDLQDLVLENKILKEKLEKINVITKTDYSEIYDLITAIVTIDNIVNDL